jgi:hypothetical protein
MKKSRKKKQGEKNVKTVKNLGTDWWSLAGNSGRTLLVSLAMSKSTNNLSVKSGNTSSFSTNMSEAQK